MEFLVLVVEALGSIMVCSSLHSRKVRKNFVVRSQPNRRRHGQRKRECPSLQKFHRTRRARPDAHINLPLCGKPPKMTKAYRENSGRYLSRFLGMRIVELIFVTIGGPLRQAFLSNIRREAFSQRVEPDALLLQRFHQI